MPNVLIKVLLNIRRKLYDTVRSQREHYHSSRNTTNKTLNKHAPLIKGVKNMSPGPVDHKRPDLTNIKTYGLIHVN